MTPEQLLATLESLTDRLAALEARAESNIASAASLMGRVTSDKKASAARKNGAKRWAGHVKNSLK